nr:hypothetical protein [uncultured Draconibacterium sp.]
MKKVFQQKIDQNQGDCMQAVIASLFDLELKDVPPFIEYGQDWFRYFYEFLHSIGWDYAGMRYNHKYQKILQPTNDCFEKSKHCMLLDDIKDEPGVNGLFYASVLSPKYFSWEIQTTHAVIIDKDFNVVHDPSPLYKNIQQYPLADIIGYNGIINFYMIEPLKQE